MGLLFCASCSALMTGTKKAPAEVSHLICSPSPSFHAHIPCLCRQEDGGRAARGGGDDIRPMRGSSGVFDTPDTSVSSVAEPSAEWTAANDGIMDDMRAHLKRRKKRAKVCAPGCLDAQQLCMCVNVFCAAGRRISLGVAQSGLSLISSAQSTSTTSGSLLACSLVLGCGMCSTLGRTSSQNMTTDAIFLRAPPRCSGLCDVLRYALATRAVGGKHRRAVSCGLHR